MPRYCCSVAPALTPSSAVVVLPPAPQASALAGTAVEVTSSAKPIAFRITPTSGAVAAAPDPFSTTEPEIVTVVPPTYGLVRSSDPLASLVCPVRVSKFMLPSSTLTESVFAGLATEPSPVCALTRITGFLVRSAIV